MKKLVLIAATGNRHKIDEFREIFNSISGENGIDVLSEREAIDRFAGVRQIYEQPEETGSTFAANAFIKSSALYGFIENGIRSYLKEHAGECDIIVAADDSGLCVNALGGAPGVMSARYASLNKDNASDADNVAKLLSEMENVPDGERTAHFACAISAILIKNSEAPVELISSEGSMPGVIAREIRGRNGFGYDPVMYIPALGKCVAELTPEEKNSISHRGQALRRLAQRYFTGKCI